MGVTEDLMVKISEDVSNAMHRTLALSDEKLPVAVAGGAIAIGTISAFLEAAEGKRKPGSDPDPDYVLLAALMCAHALVCAHTGNRCHDPIKQAYKDLEILKKAGQKVNSIT